MRAREAEARGQSQGERRQRHRENLLHVHLGVSNADRASPSRMWSFLVLPKPLRGTNACAPRKERASFSLTQKVAKRRGADDELGHLRAARLCDTPHLARDLDVLGVALARVDER